MKRLIAFCLGLSIIAGCVGPNSYLFRDKPYLISPARRLAEDYLEGQKRGETYREASSKYGKGVSEFYNLKEYRYENAGYFMSSPILRYRIQATNQMGGILWKSYDIAFSYDEKLAIQEPYEGLSISGISEAMF